MSPFGSLTVSFSKAILPLPLTLAPVMEAGTKRSLQVQLENVIRMNIEDQDTELDKNIASVEIIEIGTTYFIVHVEFADTTAITSQLLEPDTLIVTIDMPELFVDAETGQPLASEPIEYKILMGMQFTVAEFEELTAKAGKAAQISIGITILEIVIILMFKKVLFSMWVLILTLQFFVYISLWQVRYPSILHFLLYELKRVALGEFMDDLDLGGIAMEWIGLEPNDASSTEEKLGEERLGSANLF